MSNQSPFKKSSRGDDAFFYLLGFLVSITVCIKIFTLWFFKGVDLQPMKKEGDKVAPPVRRSHNGFHFVAMMADGVRTGMKFQSKMTWYVAKTDHNRWYDQAM